MVACRQVWDALLFQVPVAMKLPKDEEGTTGGLLEEVEAYEALAPLQGDCIPRFVANGFFMVS